MVAGVDSSAAVALPPPAALTPNGRIVKPLLIEAWDEPRHEEFAPRTTWSLFNAFTEVQKGSGPRAQMEGSLRLSSLFRRELALA